MSVVMNTKLPSVKNTRKVNIVSEGEADVQIITGTVPDNPPPVRQRQETRMRSNISRELEALGFKK